MAKSRGSPLAAPTKTEISARQACSALRMRAAARAGGDVEREGGGGPSSTGGGFNFANATTTRYDFYLQDEIELLNGRWTITPGLRYANYNIDPRLGQNYVIVPGKEPRELDSHRVIPQVGTLFKLDETYSLYARYAEGFKMPTAQQLYTSSPGVTFNLVPNPDLRPETIRTLEAGLRSRKIGTGRAVCGQPV